MKHSHHPHLHHQTVEIRLPNRTRLYVNAEVLAHALVERFGGSVMSYFRDPSLLLLQIFRIPLADLALMSFSVSGPMDGADHVLWAQIAAHPLGTEPCPFTLHLDAPASEAQPKQPEQGLTPAQTRDLEQGIAKVVELMNSGESLRASALLEGMGLSLRTALGAVPAPVYQDGWGHTSEDASVEDLLREGDAALKGTDKHEQVIQQLLGEDNAKGAIQMLLGALKDQGAQINALKQARIDDLKRLHELGAWLQGELGSPVGNSPVGQVMATFALQLSRLGINPHKCPACQPR